MIAGVSAEEKEGERLGNLAPHSSTPKALADPRL